MKRQIRQSCFETNSSSTHAICIATDGIRKQIPETINFYFGDYGWEWRTLTTISDRASYLYTCLMYMNLDEIEKCTTFILETLKKYGVKEINFENFEVNVSNFSGHIWLTTKNDNYIDHGSDTIDFAKAVCSDEQLLLDYLFGEHSFIQTGNDNDDGDVDIKVDYPHIEYYKWN